MVRAMEQRPDASEPTASVLSPTEEDGEGHPVIGAATVATDSWRRRRTAQFDGPHFRLMATGHLHIAGYAVLGG